MRYWKAADIFIQTIYGDDWRPGFVAPGGLWSMWHRGGWFWALTHVPTGMVVGDFRKAGQAMRCTRLIEALVALDWARTDWKYYHGTMDTGVYAVLIGAGALNLLNPGHRALPVRSVVPVQSGEPIPLVMSWTSGNTGQVRVCINGQLWPLGRAS